jgi:hypothetical protein
VFAEIVGHVLMCYPCGRICCCPSLARYIATSLQSCPAHAALPLKEWQQVAGNQCGSVQASSGGVAGCCAWGCCAAGSGRVGSGQVGRKAETCMAVAWGSGSTGLICDRLMVSGLGQLFFGHFC